MWQHRQWRFSRDPAERLSFAERSSRCWIWSPIPCPTFPKYCIYLYNIIWLLYEEGVCCTRCYAMSAALAPSSCNQVYSRCAHHLSERAHTPIPGLSNTHYPYATNKSTAVEACNRRHHAPVGSMGKRALHVWHGKTICQGSVATQKSCTHASTQPKHHSTP
jgi:hypothetical protein